MKKIPAAQIISWVTTPVLVFAVGLVLLVARQGIGDFVSALIFGLTGATPMLLAALWVYLREDTTFDFSRKQRELVFFVGVISFSVASVVFGSQLHTDLNWYHLSLVSASMWGLCFIVNRYFDKLSIHVLMFAFVVTLLASQSDALYGLLLSLLPVVVWSRIKLKKHEWSEVLWGLVVGMSMGLLSWLI